MIREDVSVWTLRFCAGGGEKDGGFENLDSDSVYVLLRFIRYGVNEIEMGLL